MKVKELREILEMYGDGIEVEISGCYGSEGTIDKVLPDEKQKRIILISDICSG